MLGGVLNSFYSINVKIYSLCNIGTVPTSVKVGKRCPSFQVINIEESLAVLTRCSFDESHRQPIFLLGGIPALAEIIQVPLIILVTKDLAEIFQEIPALAEIILDPKI
jgi:hypothetical protein